MYYSRSYSYSGDYDQSSWLGVVFGVLQSHSLDCQPLDSNVLERCSGIGLARSLGIDLPNRL
ncbi:hypothetical protein Alg130_12388, partial [Pyrenophora tritici-repentis]